MPAGRAHEHAVDRAGRIFAILKQAAERRVPCPTTPILAERFGCSKASVRASLHFLELAGMIVIEWRGAERVVQIRATGHRTAVVGRLTDEPKKRRAEA